jgi:hypothetical protein
LEGASRISASDGARDKGCLHVNRVQYPLLSSWKCITIFAVKGEVIFSPSEEPNRSLLYNEVSRYIKCCSSIPHFLFQWIRSFGLRRLFSEEIEVYSILM